MQEIIIAENLTKIFGATTALDNVTIKLGYGIHLLLGPNGSGKTTFIKLCLGLIKPSKGILEVLGLRPWLYRHVLSPRVSYVVEGFNIPWWLSGRDYALMFSRLRGVNWNIIKENAYYLGVVNYWNRPIYTYSSGMKKRLVLALGLIEGYEVYLLDEPFTLIDDNTKRKVINLIEKLGKNSTMIISTHVLLEQLSRIADTASILVNGKLRLHVHTHSNKMDIPVKVIVRTDDIHKLLNIVKNYVGINRIEVNIAEKSIVFTITLNYWNEIKEMFKNYTYDVYIDIGKLYTEIVST